MALLAGIRLHIVSKASACCSSVWKCSVCGVCFENESQVREHFASEHMFAPLDEVC
ncbi:hypothetical protein COEREDRAFT_80703 [Coemansia reversa NRRL 1564]|uniref:C2H2-type domain-containing protein n=1 Tax=Coemansia reversa (strain ATCC 12441 / NRRL 1564) TaxID=763665 RepID=A0A2G5BD66_COERN|nr:hypothetical protein COEREDRAFT_80703 [Coemansia reversa NRRL 1564]|eukprot:PIA16964.1 hypothetical protein COEREDRAFT_80703 [Coemansia reversa NRRL 1564]